MELDDKKVITLYDASIAFCYHEFCKLNSRKTGLVIIDAVKGFCAPGMGPFAPPADDECVPAMVEELSHLAKNFCQYDAPICLFKDTHDGEEHPYPLHCQRGSAESEIVEELTWLLERNNATVIEKNCTDGFVGAIDLQTNVNRFVEWADKNSLETIVVGGICTDICVLDTCISILSAINHGSFKTLKKVVIAMNAVTTYDFPGTDADLGDSHFRTVYDFFTFNLLNTRGAIIAGLVGLE